MSSSALYAWRKRHHSPSPQDPPSTHNARPVAVAIQAEPGFELRLRGGNVQRFPEGATTSLVADLLRALELLRRPLGRSCDVRVTTMTTASQPDDARR